MGLFGGLFESKSSSSTTTNTTNNITDLRAGAEGGGSAITQPQFDGNLIVGSDDVARSAIESAINNSQNALAVSTDFLSQAFSSILTQVDRTEERAQSNIQAANTLAKDIIAEEQESTNDQITNLVRVGLFAGVAIVAIQSGILKDLRGVFK